MKDFVETLSSSNHNLDSGSMLDEFSSHGAVFSSQIAMMKLKICYSSDWLLLHSNTAEAHGYISI